MDPGNHPHKDCRRSESVPTLRHQGPGVGRRLHSRAFLRFAFVRGGGTTMSSFAVAALSSVASYMFVRWAVPLFNIVYTSRVDKRVFMPGHRRCRFRSEALSLLRPRGSISWYRHLTTAWSARMNDKVPSSSVGARGAHAEL